MSDKPAKKTPWEVWRDRLPAGTAARIDAPPAAHAATDFDAFVGALGPKAAAAVAAVSDGPPPPPEEVCKEAEKRFGAVVSESGEFAQLIMFRDADSLAKYLGAAEGDDKVVWCFHGVPLRFTVGPQRYLMMPDGLTAASVPVTPGAKILRVEADLIGTDFQEDGFVGPAHLANNDGLQVEAPPEPGTNKALDDDEAGEEVA